MQESIVKAMDKALERAIGNKAIDFEKCEGNYLDVYPLIGAVLQKELRSVLGENVNKSISRNMKIKATKYRNDYRVWLDYAGDYRNENTDRMGSMMDIDIYILKEEDRPYECHYLKDLLEDRVARIAKMHEDESYTYNMDDNYWCATCGSHSHKKDSKTGYCWYCDTVNWVKEDGKDVGI